MTYLAEGASNQILLIANDLLGQSLAIQLNSTDRSLEVLLNEEKLTRHPCTVIWNVDALEAPDAIRLELRKLQQFWYPAPVLLVIPASSRLNESELLQFDCPGLLQDPDLNTLKKAITTLRGGGRMVRLKCSSPKSEMVVQPTMGLADWLLLSGLQQINNDLQCVESQLSPASKSTLLIMLNKGRRRELKTAKYFLLWLWGPRQVLIKQNLQTNNSSPTEDSGTSITLLDKSPVSVWSAIKNRINAEIKHGLVNSTGGILALESLNNPRQKELLNSLLLQLDQIIQKLREQEITEVPYFETWLAIQPELRKQAVREMIGSYVRLPWEGALTPVAEKLLEISSLEDSDEDLPSPEFMLNSLVLNKTIEVNGQFLSPDDPRGLIQLERFVSNWLIRTSELVSAGILGSCGEWPELRRYLLNPNLISTRELERLRNQLNSLNRWKSFIQRPIQIYESKRLLYTIKEGAISPIYVTEPRDEELRKLDWLQQQVALLVEARDALAPQLQALVKKVGDLMVVILTQVIGRAIGLIGKGIAQGMGRSLGRS